MIKIEMLRCFSAVAQTGNLLEAANRLGRTQSAVSMTLKQLEEHVGDRLFLSDRKNRLTPLGEQVFALSQTQLRLFDETIRAIEASAKAPKGFIRIASVPSVAGLVFPNVIETMTKRHPSLKIELRDTDTEQVTYALFHGQADLGVASGQIAMNGIRQTPLFTDRFGLICSREHPLASQDSNPTIVDVASAKFVKNNLCRLIETSYFHEITDDASLTARNTSSLIAMVRTKNWVTVLPQTVVQLAPTELVFREIEGLSDCRQVNLFLREKSPFFDYASELGDLITNFDWSFTNSAAGTEEYS